MIIHFLRNVRFWSFKRKNAGYSNNQLTQLSINQIYAVFLVSVLVTVVVIGTREIGGLQSLELMTFDRMVRLLPQQLIDPRLLVVEINEADIENQGQWPLSDRAIAQAIKNLQKHDPKVIGLDLYRNLPYPPGDRELHQVLKQENIITITKVDDNDSQGIAAPSSVPEDRIGFSDFVLDTDNVLRRNLLYAEGGTEKFYSFALRVSLQYLGKTSSAFQVTPDFLQLDRAIFPRLYSNSGGYQLSASEAVGWQVLLKYRRGDRVARQVSITDILQGNVDPSWIEDKIILIGTTAPSAKDLFTTPYSAAQTDNYLMPGVIIHAQMVSQILSTVLDNQPLFGSWTEFGEWLWIGAWALLGGILAWRLNHPVSLGLAIGIGIGSLWGTGVILLWRSLWIPVVPPALTFILSSGSVLAYKVFYSLYYDSLTGLPNRRSFIQRLHHINQWKRSRHTLISVFLLDFDRFKRINESLGHQAGNALLIESAQRLQQKLGSKECLARVGEDEFAIWLDSIGDMQEAIHMAHSLQQELTQVFLWQGEEIFTNVSIGIACDRARATFQPENLLRYADIAMYRAKESGCPEIFLSTMGKQTVRRWQLERDMRKAIKQKQFEIYYQPIICLKTSKIAGFEALVRWQSPQRGFVTPGEFIPVAEETGLIIPLGIWILQQACHQIRHWQEQFPQDPPLILSVNLSNRQFLQTDLVKKIQEILEFVGIAENSLKLEITETAMMKDMEGTISLLQQLKDLGVRLSIDDFGTGYSSLSYLHRLPIDSLKIDKSFVSNMNGEDNTHKYTQIVSAIVMLGHNLDLDVIAEGIETKIQKEILQSLNCKYGQGYLFSKPLPSHAITELLAQQ